MTNTTERPPTDAEQAPNSLAGVWVAYYDDRSAAYVYGDEVSALRAAVDKSAQVKFVPFGEDVFE